MTSPLARQALPVPSTLAALPAAMTTWAYEHGVEIAMYGEDGRTVYRLDLQIPGTDRWVPTYTTHDEAVAVGMFIAAAGVREHERAWKR